MPHYTINEMENGVASHKLAGSCQRQETVIGDCKMFCGRLEFLYRLPTGARVARLIHIRSREEPYQVSCSKVDVARAPAYVPLLLRAPRASNARRCYSPNSGAYREYSLAAIAVCSAAERVLNASFRTDAIPTLFPNIPAHLSKKLPSKRKSVTSSGGVPRKQKRDDVIREDDHIVVANITPVTQPSIKEKMESMKEENLPSKY
ncbi:hypothetical protein HPB47_024952 [Ixodes persulcatus]|uniref:Uncharacterized protein n=1 Tax=Ixodes persulcatus TaxID=34615 RepID=A0AC60Q3C8_IXOPE|nr:hypothetical protein HPB47_024952 [Ixodes persulcatus]